MTLGEITALITANIDTTGRRLTTGIKMREVLNGIVAYLSGMPAFAVSGQVWEDDVEYRPRPLLGTPFSIETGSAVTLVVIINISRGSEWGEIAVSGSGDSEFTVLFIPTSVAAGECVAGIGLRLDRSVEGTYTYTINIGGVERGVIVEVEGA